MIRIRYLPNRFDHSNCTEESAVFSREKKLADYLFAIEQKGAPKVDFKRFTIIVSGKVVETPDYFVNDQDDIIVTPKIEDPVTIGTIFAYAAGTLGASAATMMTAYAVGFWVGVGLMVAAVGFSIYSAFNRPSMPSFGGTSGGGGLDEGSPTYGWEGGRTLSDVNVPVPVVYGRHKIYGNVINEYIHTDGDTHYLNMLIALCEGEIESIDEIKLNDNPITNFQGVSTVNRLGTNDQAIVPNFEDLHNLIDVNVQLLKDSAYIYTTIDSDVEAFELRLTLPSGLYAIDATSGEINSWTVSYKVEYKLTSSGVWIDLGTTDISDKKRAALYRVFRKDGLTAGKYDIRITKTSDDSSLSPSRTGDLYISQVDEIKTDDLIYPNTALIAIEALAYEQLSGRRPKFSCIIEGKKVSVPQVLLDAVEVDWEDYYWDPNTEEFKLLSDDTVLTWDGSTYVDKYSANPIWCLKDLITKDRYGLGEFIPAALVTNASILDMALYAEERVPDGNGGYEKRFRLDVVIDSFTKALDLIFQLSATFNAFTYYSGGAVKLGVDRPESPVYTYGMGNIIENSFKQTWKSIKDTPNEIEIQFLDRDKDYEQETISLRDEEALNNGDIVRTHRVRLYCTGVAQALRAARYALNIGKHINRGCSFRASIEGIANQVGDIINVSHDVPQWGFSGRVQASSTDTVVKLDQSVIIEEGKTYKLQVKFADDTIEERTVSDTAGTYTELTVSSAFSQAPAAYDVYAFGETEILVKPFRVYAMRRDENDEVEIECMEYIAEVFNDAAVELPQNNYSALSREVPDVTDLAVVEKNILLNDGTIGSILEVYFTRPERVSFAINQYQSAKIYLSDNAGDSWKAVGQTFSDSFAITEGIEADKTYLVAVVSRTAGGAENTVADSPQEEVTTLGKLLPPSNVSSFDVQQQGDRLRFIWSPITDKDLARYVIKRGSDWESGQIIAEKVDVTEFTYPIGSIGEETYMIKAVDTTGNESVSPAADTIVVTPPPEMNFVVQVDPWARSREYKLSNVSWIPTNLYSPRYNRDTLVLKTTDTWADIEGAEIQGLDIGAKTFETSGYSEQVKAIDLGVMFEFNIIVDVLLKNVTGGSVTVEIAYSEDNVTYTAFATVDPNINYRARYIKFKYILAGDGTNQVFFYAGTIFINAPNPKTDFGRDVAIDAGGTFITFRDDFTATPRISSLVIKNGVVGILKVVDIDETGMTIRVRDPETASFIGGAEIDWEVRGS